MSKQLVEKLRKQREVRVELEKPKGGKFTVLALRPTDLEMTGIKALSGDDQVRRTLDFVFGWEGIVEDDIVGGAGMDAIKFDAELWRAWSSDNAALWEPLAVKLMDAYVAHLGLEADAAKN